jgi:hypothetical protein
MNHENAQPASPGQRTALEHADRLLAAGNELANRKLPGHGSDPALLAVLIGLCELLEALKHGR